MGFLSTVLGGLGTALKSPIGGAIAGTLINTAGNALNTTVQNALNRGSTSSAMSQSSAGESSVTSSGQTSTTGQTATTGGTETEQIQQGNTQGIANALMSALGTATGNNAGSAAQFGLKSAQTANNLQAAMWAGGNLLNLTSNVITNLMNARSQSSAMRFNKEESKLERDWSEAMRKTAYQDTVEDLKKAGLNPILAATQGPTGNYSGAEGSIGAQSYQQMGSIGIPAAHTATMQAMYDYGNNTSQFVDNMLATINNAKQMGYSKEASWLEQAFTEGTSSSAKTIESYANRSSGSTSESYSNQSGSTTRGNSSSESKSKELSGNLSIGK